MAKSVKKDTTKKDSIPKEEKISWKLKKQYKVLLGCLFVLFSIGLLLALISFFVHGHEDQSIVNQIDNRSEIAKNWLGKVGAYVADLFIYKGFGVASFLFVKLLFLTGAFLVLNLPLKKLKATWFWDLFAVILISILFGFFATSLPELGGTVGYEMNLFFQDFIGKTGTLLVLISGIIVYLLFKIKISPDAIKSFFEKKQKDISADINEMMTPASDSAYNLEEYAVNETKDEDIFSKSSQFEINKDSLKPTISSYSEIVLEPILKGSTVTTPKLQITEPELIKTNDDTFVIEKVHDDDTIEENLAAKIVADFGLFDPTLELSNYKFPTIDLLKEYSSVGITINQEELEENKNKIVETLRNY